MKVKQNLFGIVANFQDAKTGFRSIFQISSSCVSADGSVFGSMIGGGTAPASKGHGEWVDFAELSAFRMNGKAIDIQH